MTVDRNTDSFAPFLETLEIERQKQALEDAVKLGIEMDWEVLAHFAPKLTIEQAVAIVHGEKQE